MIKVKAEIGPNKYSNIFYKLKRCPNCYSGNIRLGFSGSSAMQIRCHDCWVRGSNIYAKSNENYNDVCILLALEWNTRKSFEHYIKKELNRIVGHQKEYLSFDCYMKDGHPIIILSKDKYMVDAIRTLNNLKKQKTIHWSNVKNKNKSLDIYREYFNSTIKSAIQYW